jgi:hypothetical protein
MRYAEKDRPPEFPGVMAAVEGFMKLHKVKECLHVHISDISGSVYDDVNMSGL